MYIQPIFSETDKNILVEFINSLSFGSLIIKGNDNIEVNHIPFEYINDKNGLGLLRAHVSSKNPCCELMRENTDVLAVFIGPNAYISPSWMPGSKTHRKVAPSWNYAAVHVYGTAKAVNEPQWILEHVASLTELRESKRAKPWLLEEADAGFVKNMPKYITGIEISITDIQGKFQASQQYSEKTRIAIQDALASECGEMGKQVEKMISDRSN